MMVQPVNNGNGALALIIIFVMCALMALGFLIKEKVDALPEVDVTPLINQSTGARSSGSPITSSDTAPSVGKSGNQIPSTGNVTMNTPAVSITQTAEAMNFRATATSQALSCEATKVHLSILQSQADRQSTEQVALFQATQVANNLVNLEKARSYMVTQTAQASLQKVEESQAVVQAATPWVYMGLTVVGGLSIAGFVLANAYRVQCNAKAKLQLAQANQCVEKRRLLQVESAIAVKRSQIQRQS